MDNSNLGYSKQNDFQEPFLITQKRSNIIQQMIRIKPTQEGLHAHDPDMPKFKQTLKMHELTMFGVGNTIGAGVFALIGIAAHYAGPSLFLAFIISGLIALNTALVYAEFAARMPFSGSGYSYIYSSFGELPAWIVGWNQNLRYGVTAAALSRGWSSYFVNFFRTLGVTIPLSLYSIQIFGYEGSPITVLYVIFCTYIVNMGSNESNVFNYVFTVGKLVTLLFIAIVGFTFFNIDNFEPFYLEDKGFEGVIEASLLLFFTYLGFDFIACLAEESKNPKKDLPVSILNTLWICAAIYCIISISLTGITPLTQFEGKTAMPRAFEFVGCNWMSYVISVSALCGITACAFTNIMSQARILYAYALDGLFFKVFKEIDHKKNVPVKGAWIVCLFICIVCFFLDLEELTKLISLGSLMNFSLIDAGVIALRFRKAEASNNANPLQVTRSPKEIYPFSFLVTSFIAILSYTKDWHFIIYYFFGAITLALFVYLHLIKQEPQTFTSFKCPLVPLIPCLGILGNFVLVAKADNMSWVYFLIYEAMGVFFYFCYGLQHSKLNKQHLINESANLSQSIQQPANF